MFLSMIRVCLAFIVGFSVLSGGAALGAEPLICRGGQMFVSFRTDPDGTLRNVPRVKITASFWFKPAQGPVQRVGLHPGECGWLDRAFRNGEPHEVCEGYSQPGGTHEVSWLLESEVGHQVEQREVLGYVTGGTPNRGPFSFLRDPQKYWTFQVSARGKVYPKAPPCLYLDSYAPGPVVPAPASASAPRSKPVVVPVDTVYKYTARLATIAKVQGNVVATGITWRCHRDTCTTVAAIADPNPGLEKCNALARQVGRIVSYGHNTRRLSTSELSRCNEGVAPALNVKPVTPRVLPQLQPKDLTQ